MRVGLIAPPWLPVPPRAYGGTEAVVGELCRGLRAAGHDPVLAAHPDSGATAERPPVPAPPGDRLGSAAEEHRFARAARVVLERADVDVVHDHTATGPAPGSVPWVTTMHGVPDRRLRRRYRRAGRAGAVVAISRSQAGGAEAAGIPVVRVVHHGVDPDAFPVGDGAGGHLLHLGRMSPDKGIDAAVRVARRAGLPLVIASKVREPDERRYFDAVIRPVLGPGVEFVGEVGGADKARLLGSALALLNPLRWPEPFGMVMVEALACGTPVVCTPCGAAPEIVDDEVGRVAATEDELVRAVLDVAAVDRAACRRRVEERFCTARMVADYVELYGALAGTHTTGSRPLSGTG